MSVLTSLLLGLACLTWIGDVNTAGNVGCFFDDELCLEEEHCYNDKAFGRCHLQGSAPPPETTSPLLDTSRKLLERELRRLVSGGYRWSHRYTQCVVQNLLQSERNALKYDPGICARMLQLTLPEVAKEIVQDLEAIGPEEQALIRFHPSLLEDHPEFADELFTPLAREEAEELEELNEEALRLGQLLTKRSRHSFRGLEEPLWRHDEPLRRNEEPPTRNEEQLRRNEDPLRRNEEPLRRNEDPLRRIEEPLRRVEEEEEEPQELEELRTWLEPLRDAWVQISGQRSSDDKLPDPELPVVRTDLTSDLSRRPAYTEGGVQWLPVPADEATEEILAQTPHPNQDRLLAPPPDSSDKLKDTPQQASFLASSTDGASKQASDAFWREVNEANNIKDAGVETPEFSNSISSTKDEAEQELVQALPEMEDLWRPVVEEEGNDAVPPDLIAFSRPMRYDIKKPGPAYYVHEPEDDTPEAQEQQMLALLRSAQREQEVQKWESYPKLPPPEPASLVANVDDEEATLQDLVRKSNHKSESGNQRPIQNQVDDSLQEKKRERDVVRSGPDPPSQAEAVPHPLKHQLEMVDTSHVYLLLEETDASSEDGDGLVRHLERLLSLPRGIFSNIKTENDRVTFKVNPNAQHLNASTVAQKAEILAEELKKSDKLTVLDAGVGDNSYFEVIHQPGEDRRLFILTFIVCGSVVGILLAVSVVYLVRRHARSRQKLQNIAQPDSEPSQDYQDLCRQRMQRKGSEKPEPVHRSSQSGASGPPQHPKRVSSLSQSENSQASQSSRSSTSSWSEEPVTSNMDISTGHMILSYMEDHLKNRDRLEREWEALCAYEAEPCAAVAASLPHNVNKNRYPDVLPYDHSRVVLNDLTNVSTSDYINASTITDHDPRNPAYIATQGPLPHTAADFWQMIWEQGSVVAVTLTRLMENGMALCHRYWPEEGSEVYHIYEVHLVSEHIWCDDYLVRSFYLKNLKTSETRTVTQFHFLSWPENGVPASTKALLEFRRKVNKSYRGRSCPIVVHCSDGSGRTGTYCLIDMVLNRMAKGAKEIDIAATLEHIRDQRPGMVKTQAQFEFVLMAIAEEVHAILKALSN